MCVPLKKIQYGRNVRVRVESHLYILQLLTVLCPKVNDFVSFYNFLNYEFL